MSPELPQIGNKNIQAIIRKNEHAIHVFDFQTMKLRPVSPCSLTVGPSVMNLAQAKIRSAKHAA
jgi:hypothetical protein